VSSVQMSVGCVSMFLSLSLFSEGEVRDWAELILLVRRKRGRLFEFWVW
jgi:hypothetical protein